MCDVGWGCVIRKWATSNFLQHEEKLMNPNPPAEQMQKIARIEEPVFFMHRNWVREY